MPTKVSTAQMCPIWYAIDSDRGRAASHDPMAWVGNSTQKIHFCVMYRPDE